MNYELAKKLKDTGFPQKSKYEGDICQYDNLHHLGYYISKDNKNVYVPTLSELIEACGDRFSFLAVLQGTQGKIWRASVPGEVFWWNGSTPEEAVANLWLELNKKLI